MRRTAALLAGALGCGPDPPPPFPLSGDEGPVFDDAHVLVVPDAEGVSFVDADGRRSSMPWLTLLGVEDCEGCEGQGAEPDGDGMLLAYAVDQSGGGVIRLDARAAPQWTIGGLRFPHDAVRDPADGAVIVPEAGADRLVWVDAGGAVLRDMPGLAVPNGLDRVGAAGLDLLLVSTRGRGLDSGAVFLVELRPDEPASIRWTLHGLDAPHAPLVRRRDDQYWILWAEASGAGRVGVAVTADLLRAPRRIAELVPPDDAPFGMLRGVELTRDGWLYLTDSTGPRGGRVLRTALPKIEPGREGQVVVLDSLEVLIEGLPRPFEGWLWAAPPAF